ncbi:MAG: CHASE2 domain-containing protein [Verrucomicrobiota bacterium]
MPEKYYEKSLRLRTLAVLLFSLLVTAASIFAYKSHMTLLLEEALLDYLQRRAPQNYPTESPIVLVSIEDLSFQKWPWPKLDFALILQALRSVYPQVVAFDVPFQRLDAYNPDFDKMFIKSLQRMRSVILPATALTERGLDQELTNLITIPYRGTIDSIDTYHSALWPHEKFADHVSVGFSNTSPSFNNTIRRLPLIFRWKHKIAPSWALLAYAEYLNADLFKSEVIPGKAIILRNDKREFIEEIPIDPQGHLILRYYPLEAHIKKHEFNDIILASESPNPEEIAGVDFPKLRKKLLVIARMTPSIYEPIDTPYQNNAAPVLPHLMGLHNLFHKSYIKSPSLTVLSVILFLLSFVSIALPFTFGNFRGGLYFIPLLVTEVATSILIFNLANIWLPTILIMTTMILSWLGGSILNFTFAKRKLSNQLDLFEANA